MSLIRESGVLLKSDEEIRGEIISKFKGNLGLEDIHFSRGTPWDSIANVLFDMMKLLQETVARHYSDSFLLSAEGRALERAALPLQRSSASRAVAKLKLKVSTTTRIPRGSEFVDGSGSLKFLSDGDVTISGVGLVGVTAEGVGSRYNLMGNSLRLVSNLPTVSSVGHGDILTGKDEESDDELRLRAISAVLFNTSGSRDAIISDLRSVVGVRDVVVDDRSKDSSSISNALFVYVEGGSDVDVFLKLKERVTVGTRLDGSLSKTFRDARTNFEVTYKFSRFTYKEISRLVISYKKDRELNSGEQVLIKDRIVSYVGGTLSTGVVVNPNPSRVISVSAILLLFYDSGDLSDSSIDVTSSGVRLGVDGVAASSVPPNFTISYPASEKYKIRYNSIILRKI